MGNRIRIKEETGLTETGRKALRVSLQEWKPQHQCLQYQQQMQ